MATLLGGYFLASRSADRHPLKKAVADVPVCVDFTHPSPTNEKNHDE